MFSIAIIPPLLLAIIQGAHQPPSCNSSWELPFDHIDNGQWINSPPSNPRGFHPLHLALLPPIPSASIPNPSKCRVLTWDYESDNHDAVHNWQRWSLLDFGEQDVPMPSVINGELEIEVGGDLFCPGFTWHPEDVLVIAGGTKHYKKNYGSWVGANLIYFFAPSKINGNSISPWCEATEVLMESRWYPTVIQTHDNKIAVFGGTDANATNSWELWSISNNSGDITIQNETKYAIFNWNNCGNFGAYPRMYSLTTGDILRVGPSGLTTTLDYSSNPNGNIWHSGVMSSFSWTKYGTAIRRPIDLYSPAIQDEIWKIGGEGISNCNANQASFHGQTEKITVDSSGAINIDSTSLPNLNVNRKWLNGVTLPDGTPFVFGGTSSTVFDGPYSAEYFDEVVGQWIETGDSDSLRNYHSAAIVLPDARVLVAGGENRSADYQIFRPAYLCPTHQRPVIQSPPNQNYSYSDIGSLEATLNSTNPTFQVNLLKPGTATHHTDYDSRLIKLVTTTSPSTSGVGWDVVFTLPSSPQIAPAGWWMLFVLSEDGTPAVAEWIKLQ